MKGIISILQSSLNKCGNDIAKVDQRWSVCPFVTLLSSLGTSLSGLEMDVRNLSFQADSFDVAIDKGASCFNPIPDISIVTFGRNNGCHDDSQRGRLGMSKIDLCVKTSFI